MENGRRDRETFLVKGRDDIRKEKRQSKALGTETFLGVVVGVWVYKIPEETRTQHDTPLVDINETCNNTIRWLER